MNLTAEDIVALTGRPLRTIQHRLKVWRERGGPVVRLPRPGRIGGFHLAVPLTAYCASRQVEPEKVLAVLGRQAA